MKIKNINSNKMISKRLKQKRNNTFAEGRIAQNMHQIARIYIVVPQQKWNNTYLETKYKLKGGNVANYSF